MVLCTKKLKRAYHGLSCTKKVTSFGITVVLLWVLGVLDKAREDNFENFNWPRANQQEQYTSKLIQFPKCRFTDDGLKLMIIVKSSAKNGPIRESVRKTWGKYNNQNGIEVMPMFVVGHVDNSEVRRRIDKESEKNKDVLAISAIDSYRNNTFKLFAAIEYAARPIECSSPDFVFLVDDDYMVHIPNLIKFAKTKRKTSPIYEGFVFDTSPFRLKIHKHSISLADYPYSRYPPYVSAGAVFLSADTVRRFEASMRQLKIFPFDDVFTGILAKTVGVSVTHNENFVFWSRQVSREEWTKGVIAVHGYATIDLENEYNELFG